MHRKVKLTIFYSNPPSEPYEIMESMKFRRKTQFSMGFNLAPTKLRLSHLFVALAHCVHCHHQNYNKIVSPLIKRLWPWPIWIPPGSRQQPPKIIIIHICLALKETHKWQNSICRAGAKNFGASEMIIGPSFCCSGQIVCGVGQLNFVSVRKRKIFNLEFMSLQKRVKFFGFINRI